MAVFTGVAAGDMTDGFAGNGTAVMAAETGTGDHAVIEVSGRPEGGGVAVVAEVPAGNVIGRFPGGGPSIVAAETSACNRTVIYVRH